MSIVFILGDKLPTWNDAALAIFSIAKKPKTVKMYVFCFKIKLYNTYCNTELNTTSSLFNNTHYFHSGYQLLILTPYHSFTCGKSRLVQIM